jgi:hypothetical protein
VTAGPWNFREVVFWGQLNATMKDLLFHNVLIEYCAVVSLHRSPGCLFTVFLHRDDEFRFFRDGTAMYRGSGRQIVDCVLDLHHSRGQDVGPERRDFVGEPWNGQGITTRRNSIRKRKGIARDAGNKDRSWLKGFDRKIRNSVN